MRAVIFDLYETLITENHPEWFGQPTLAARLGIDEETCRHEWRSGYQARMTGQIPDHAAALERICEAAGITPSRIVIDHLVAERVAAKARAFDRMETEILAMLQALRQRGMPIGLITNCTREEVAAWDSSPLPGLVDVAVFSCEVGVIKPDAEIYTFACDRLGVAPDHAYFVGDGGSDELRGARTAGLHPVWATWFIERWPWDWPADVAETAAAFPRCRAVGALPALLDTQDQTLIRKAPQ